MSDPSPYAPPKSELVEAGYGALTRKSRYVIVKPNMEWPSRCFKCNRETELKKEVRLTYLNPWIYLSILINFLILLILALIFRKTFRVDLPLCEEHTKKRRYFLIFQWSALLLLIAMLILGAVAETVIVTYIAILLFAAVVISAIFGRLAFAARFRNGHIWVTGAGKSFLNSLPEHLA